MKTIIANKVHNCEHKLGKYLDESDYDILVESDMDFFAPIKEIGRTEPLEKECIFKFRKNRFTAEEQSSAYEGLVNAALPTQNRGLAAGPKGERQGGRNWCNESQIEIMELLIQGERSSLFSTGENPIEEIRRKHASYEAPKDPRGIVWIKSKIEKEGYDYETFFETKLNEILALPPLERSKATQDLYDNYVSNTTYANQVLSGIAGFFDRYPRIPWGRATSYTEHHRETYEKCYPFMRKLSSEFQRLLPERFGVQNEAAAKLDPRFRVAGEDTPFTTITVNKNFRTSAHRDAGDLHAGFSNLSVIAKDKEWEGGYLVLPEYRVAINIRPGDLLLINNHEGIHGNTELVPPSGKKVEDMERISLVCYFREKMLELGSWEYEALRRKFVETRSKDITHPLYRPLWNGVSSSMWNQQEWFSFLERNGGKNFLKEYHPNAVKEISSLEDFFV